MSGPDPVYPYDTSPATSDGLCIWGRGFDRIRIEDDSGNLWCAEDTTGCVEWGDFREECWEDVPGPAFVKGTKIYSASAVQPSRSNSGESQSGEICITSLYFWNQDWTGG